MKKLYIDFTGTYYSKLNTGIQRVVRNIIIHKKIFKEYGFYEAESVVQIGGHYWKVNIDDKLPINFTGVLHRIAAELRHFLDFLLKKKEDAKERKGEINSYKLNNEETSFHIKSVLFFRKILKKLFNITIYLDTFFTLNTFVRFRENDILFLPDAFWCADISISVIRKAKQCGTNIIVLFHDIIPLTHHDLIKDNSALDFKIKFQQLLPLLDGYICNSNFTLSEISAYLAKYYPKFKDIPSDFVYLGYDINRNKNMYKYKTAYNKQQGNIYLMVGTIEPKKNHYFVVKAFHKLWRKGIKAKLIIVGRIGWKNEKTIEKINTSPYKDKYLFMLNNASDNELIKLYSTCKALIIASSIEGFGLPLVEAMYHKKLILASNIPAFREIGQSYPIFFDLKDENSLTDAIRKIENNEIELDRPFHKLQTWENCVKDIACIMENRVIDSKKVG